MMQVLKRMSGRVAVLIVAAGVLLVLLVGWMGFVSPERSKAAALDAQVSDIQLQIADNKKLLAGPTKRQSAAAVRRLASVMPDQAQQSNIIRQLSALAKTSQVELGGITPSAAVVGATDEALPFAVAVNGHYFALQRFLRLLRASADVRHGKVIGNGRLFTVDGITFANGSGSTGAAGVISATLALNAYQNIPGVPAAAAATTTTTPAASASAAPAPGQ